MTTNSCVVEALSAVAASRPLPLPTIRKRPPLGVRERLAVASALWGRNRLLASGETLPVLACLRIAAILQVVS